MPREILSFITLNFALTSECLHAFFPPRNPSNYKSVASATDTDDKQAEEDDIIDTEQMSPDGSECVNMWVPRAFIVSLYGQEVKDFEKSQRKTGGMEHGCLESFLVKLNRYESALALFELA